MNLNVNIPILLSQSWRRFAGTAFDQPTIQRRKLLRQLFLYMILSATVHCACYVIACFARSVSEWPELFMIVSAADIPNLLENPLAQLSQICINNP